MVSLILRRKFFEKLVGVRLGDEKLRELLPQIKCGVETITKEEIAIDVTGDRPDLLSSEGVARALKGFMEEEKGLPRMDVLDSGTEMRVHESVLSVRPWIVSAYAHGIPPLGSDDIAELMQIQEKLHLTYGRRRRKVAIGIHDADKIKPPFTYKTVGPKEISFVPLGKKTKMTPQEILEKHEKGIEYAFIFEGVKKYPVIVDVENRVVSFPPIINGVLTEVTEKTRNLFLELTGTDFEACHVALNILCQNYADRGAKISSVKIKYPDRTIVTPDTTPELMSIGVGEANKLLGTAFAPHELAACLEKQRLGARVEGDFIACEIPRYRADFLHPVDLVEEMALGHGYNSFEPKKPSVFTPGSSSAVTRLQDELRDAMAAAGFLELSTYVLTNEEKINKAASMEKPISVKNPVSAEYTVLRATILPNLLEVLARNTHAPYPQKIFEIGEVVELDKTTETRTRTAISLAALTSHKDASLSEIASVLAHVVRGVVSLVPTTSKQFIPGRCAQVLLNKKPIGVVGEVRPEILEFFGIEMPVSAFEVAVGEI